MPFDGLSSLSLETLLRNLNLQPIPLEELEAHKQHELQKHPPSVLWHLRTIIPLAATLAMIMFMVSAIVLIFEVVSRGDQETIDNTLLVTIMLMSIVVLMVSLSAIKIRQPARWIETRYQMSDLPTMPRAVRNLASEVANELPSTSFVVGRLIQKKEVLDPYLLVYRPTDTMPACLAIWEDENIIRSAKNA